jgi:hypothetical protein
LAWGWLRTGRCCALVGAALRRPLIMGLVFVFGWELVTLVMPGYSEALHVGVLPPDARPARDANRGHRVTASGRCFQRAAVGCRQHWRSVLAIVASLALAARVVEQREYVLEQ